MEDTPLLSHMAACGLNTKHCHQLKGLSEQQDWLPAVLLAGPWPGCRRLHKEWGQCGQWARKMSLAAVDLDSTLGRGGAGGASRGQVQLPGIVTGGGGEGSSGCPQASRAPRRAAHGSQTSGVLSTRGQCSLAGAFLPSGGTASGLHSTVWPESRAPGLTRPRFTVGLWGQPPPQGCAQPLPCP